MIRHTFTVASLFSLLLFLAITSMAVRSYWAADSYEWWPEDWGVGELWGCSSHGCVAFGRWAGPVSNHFEGYHSDEPRSLVEGLTNANPNDTRLILPAIGLAYLHFDHEIEVSYVVVFPFWLMLTGTAVMPLCWYRTTRCRAKAGYCTSCGYDLRASKDRCPECGMPFSAKMKI